MIHSFLVYNQYLKHMDGARAGMNYSGPMVPSATFRSHWEKTELNFCEHLASPLIKGKQLMFCNAAIYSTIWQRQWEGLKRWLLLLAISWNEAIVMHSHYLEKEKKTKRDTRGKKKCWKTDSEKDRWTEKDRGSKFGQLRFTVLAVNVAA